MSERKPIVAIDGPVGAGKSTTARKVAEELGLVYVDSGAMYRAVTLDVLNHGIDTEDEQEVKKILVSIKVQMPLIDGSRRIMLNGVDVTDRIRDRDVTRVVSAVSAMKCVRDKMTDIQREIGQNGGIVMEGRDIGTVVFPDAEFKIYLDAAVEVRAERRHNELAEKGIQIPLEDLVEEIRERDRANIERSIAPLRKAEEAIYIDNSEMTFDEQVSAIASIVRGEETSNKLTKTQGVPGGWGFRTLQFIVYILLKIFYRISYEGIENIPLEGGVMIASNHASLLDPPAIGAIIPRKASYLAKMELFLGPGVKQLLKLTCSIPINRQGYTKGTLKQVINHLKDGWGLVVFPEGTRTRTGEFGKPKRGVGMIAVKAGMPIVPCWIEGSYRAKPFISKITVHFLKPIQTHEITGDTKKDNYLLVSEKIMHDIINISKTHNGRA